MSFGAAIRTCFRKYITFSGRAGRAEFWWFNALFWACILIWLFGSILTEGQGPGLALVPITLAFLAALVLLIPSFAVTWRRLHDRGRPGWIVFLPLFGILVISVSLLEIAALLFGSLLTILPAFYTYALLILPGETGPNRFGPDPSALGEEDLSHIFE